MSDENATQADEGFDDFMDGLGLNVKPLSPEDDLMLRFTSGNDNKLLIFRYWLMHEMHHYYNLLKDGAILMRFSVIKQEHVPFTKEEYVLSMTKYYLRMMYLPWFNQGVSALGIADLDKAARLLAGHEIIQKMVNTPVEELPTLRC